MALILKKNWNILISGKGLVIDMVQNGFDSSIHDHGTDLSVTMAGLLDVLDSDFQTSTCIVFIETWTAHMYIEIDLFWS